LPQKGQISGKRNLRRIVKWNSSAVPNKGKATERERLHKKKSRGLVTWGKLLWDSKKNSRKGEAPGRKGENILRPTSVSRVLPEEKDKLSRPRSGEHLTAEGVELTSAQRTPTMVKKTLTPRRQKKISRNSWGRDGREKGQFEQNSRTGIGRKGGKKRGLVGLSEKQSLGGKTRRFDVPLVRACH